MGEVKLKRNLSFISMVALASGAVIGGWLVEAPYWFQLTGAGGVIIFPVLAMLLIQLVQSPGMAFILVTALRYFTPFPDEWSKYVAMLIMILWYVMSNFNVELTGRLASVFFFAMVGISLLVSGSLFTSGHWTIANVTENGGWFPMGFTGVVTAMAVFSLKFIGFEMTPTLIEETNFPPGKIWKVVFSALLFPAILYMIVVLAMSGLAPWTELAAMDMPEPELIERFGILKLLASAAIFSGILYALTTIMGFWSSSARVLYGGAKMNYFPRIFMKLNKSGQPYLSNIFVLVMSLFFAGFTGSGNWVQYLYSVSCAAAGVIYFMACLDALMLRKKYPGWKRPFAVKGGNTVFVLGMVVSLGITVGSCMEMPVGGYVSIAIHMALGVVVFAVIEAYRKKNPGRFEPINLTPEDVEEA